MTQIVHFICVPVQLVWIGNAIQTVRNKRRGSRNHRDREDSDPSHADGGTSQNELDIRCRPTSSTAYLVAENLSVDGSLPRKSSVG